MKNITAKYVISALCLASPVSCTAAKDTGEYKVLHRAKEATERRLESTRDQLDAARERALENQVDLDAANMSIEELTSEISALKQQYDPQIRAGQQTAWDAELQRVCTAATADVALVIADSVEYRANQMDLIGNKSALILAVEACAAPERTKSAEQKLAERLASCATVDPGQVGKDPDSTKDKCFVMFVNIQQFDSNTGPCSFQGNISNIQHTYGYEYETRSQFGMLGTAVLSQLDRDCPALNGIDQDDFVRVWATGLGAYSYSTTLGGSNTIPAWKIEKIELARKG